jgi:hypothetical protein
MRNIMKSIANFMTNNVYNSSFNMLLHIVLLPSKNQNPNLTSETPLNLNQGLQSRQFVSSVLQHTGGGG